MTSPAPVDPAARLVDADREATLARERLSHTVSTLQARLSPRKLARDAAREAGAKGDVAKEAVVGAARGNPGAIAGALAGIVIFLLGRPLVRRLRRRRATEPVPTGSVPITPVTEQQP